MCGSSMKKYEVKYRALSHTSCDNLVCKSAYLDMVTWIKLPYKPLSMLIMFIALLNSICIVPVTDICLEWATLSGFDEVAQAGLFRCLIRMTQKWYNTPQMAIQ